MFSTGELYLRYRFTVVHIQEVLAGSDITDLEGLGDQANEIMSGSHHQALTVCNASFTKQCPRDFWDNSPEVHRIFCRESHVC